MSDPRHHPEELRRRAVELVAGGMSQRAAAVELGLPHETVRRWVAPRVRPPRMETISCPVCGNPFQAQWDSIRRARTRSRLGAPRCPDCAPSKRRPTEIAVTDELRRWWLDRYSLDEIVALADCFDGEVAA